MPCKFVWNLRCHYLNLYAVLFQLWESSRRIKIYIAVWRWLFEQCAAITVYQQQYIRKNGMSRSWALLVYRTFSPYIHWQKVLGTILWQSKWQRTLNQLLHPWWWIFSNTDVLSPPFYLFKSCNHYLIVNGFSKHNTVWFDADTPERYRYFNDWLDNYIHNNNVDEVL